MTSLPSEALISRAPVIVRRRVKWGECDPAGVVYTPRFADYAIAAFEHFVAELVGNPMQARLAAADLGLPMKAMSFEFRRSLWPDQEFEMTVKVTGIRTRTFDLQVDGASLDGSSVFEILMSPICIQASNRTSIAIPSFLRERLAEYMDRFPRTP